MKPPTPSGQYRPFKDLKKLLGKQALKPSPALRPSPVETDSKPPSKISAKALFQKAMAGVTPLDNRRKRAALKRAPRPVFRSHNDSDRDVLLKLKDLVQNGTGFTVSLTPEYMQGVGPQACPQLAQRLHRGDFSVQAHIDLHGLGLGEARKTFEDFLGQAVKNSLQAVLVVHGRGLSSPAAPVLKTNLYKWLTKGPWRKRVLAFASAQNYDGGAGATYIMLRRKPLSKRLCKKQNQPSK